MNTTPLTLVPTVKITDEQAFEVRRGSTFLALVSFDGARGTIRTHAGSLYADERREVYALRQTAAEKFLNEVFGR